MNAKKKIMVRKNKNKKNTRTHMNNAYRRVGERIVKEKTQQ